MSDVTYMVIGWSIGIPIGLIVSAGLIYLCDRWDLW